MVLFFVVIFLHGALSEHHMRFTTTESRICLKRASYLASIPTHDPTCPSTLRSFSFCLLIFYLPLVFHFTEMNSVYSVCLSSKCLPCYYTPIAIRCSLALKEWLVRHCKSLHRTVFSELVGLQDALSCTQRLLAGSAQTHTQPQPAMAAQRGFSKQYCIKP
uniref:Putative secreted protein n=1 Tax=Anopheles triannulatus TaxID=58253 RepID=A0A2M4B0N2_9DIPT